MSVPVYDQLRALVLSDEFGPDTMLVETALATRLGVSRTPIREALKQLRNDQLIVWPDRRSPYVPEIGVDDVPSEGATPTASGL